MAETVVKEEISGKACLTCAHESRLGRGTVCQNCKNGSCYEHSDPISEAINDLFDNRDFL